MYRALQIAKYFIALCNADEGDLLSNLKLQKLLYYGQGFHLAINGKRLFRENVEAWTYGPVVPPVYHEYKSYDNGVLPPPTDFNPDEIDEEARGILNEVFQVYGQYSAWKLANMTHEEPPWRNAFERGKSSEITDASLIEYFKTLVE
jgi:uncharacterized phage-associated protein